jgi:hypothetical protein
VQGFFPKKLTIQRLSSDKKLIRRKQHSSNPSILEYRDELEWPAEFSQAPAWLWKAVWDKDTPEAD